VTTVRNFVNGRSVDAASGQTSDLVNPTTGQVFATAPVSGPADVDAAYAAASAAFETWGDTTPAERQLALLKIADAMERSTSCASSPAPRGSLRESPQGST
jgi:betaine-aldehyde dehydrogenase